MVQRPEWVGAALACTAYLARAETPWPVQVLLCLGIGASVMMAFRPRGIR